MNRFLFALALLIPLTSPALAQNAPQIPPAPRAMKLECAGPFARDTTHAKIVTAFGAQNVQYRSVPRAEGEVVRATVVYPRDPRRRIEVEWFDQKRRARPSVITVFGASRWVGPLGVHNGMSIQEVEKIAGAPFKINGFEFDVAGAIHPGTTKLAELPGGCSFGGHFEIEGGGLPQKEEYKRFIGEGEIDSNDPLLLTLKVRLWIYTLSYPPKEQ